MPISRKFIFSLIPLVILLGLLEGASVIWERIDPPPRPLPLPKAAEVLPEKQPGEFRVLFYGGSTVLGLPEPEFGFVKQLEYYLEQVLPDRTVKLFNFAQGGQPSAYAVRKMDQSLRGSDADAVVVLSAHNEFLFITDMTDAEMDAVYAVQERLHKSAFVRRVRRLVYRYYTVNRRSEFDSEELLRVERDSVRWKERVARFERNVPTIIRLASEEGAPLFLCTGPCNLVDWSPGHTGYSKYSKDKDYLLAIGRCVELFGDGEPEALKKFLAETIDKYPEDATAVYIMGKALLREGDAEAAREFFVRAKDLDRYPFRVLSMFNDRFREQDGRSGTRVVDLERIFDAHSPDGIAGFELVADNCHPTPIGNRFIATALVNAFRDEELIDFEGEIDGLTSLSGFLEDTMSVKEIEQAYVRYFLENAKTCLKEPYHKVETSRMYLDQLLKIDPDNWVGLANLASTYYMERNIEKGSELLERAVEINGSEIEITDKDNFPILEKTMMRAGVLEKPE